MSITVKFKGQLYGWVREGRCSHPDCKKAISEGRKFHAIPAAFAVTLPDYHFAEVAQAREALLSLPSREAKPPPC